MINFLHTFNPEPVLISFGTINIYYYGLFIVLGIISAVSITLKFASYYNIKEDAIIDLAFWLIIGGIIGARIYHILLELPYYINHPLNIFKIWQGGLAIHGGIIAGVIIVWIFARKHKELSSGEAELSSLNNFWLLSAILAPGLALAQAIGRWGNYFNQELFGKPTNLSWGIPINIINRPEEYLSFNYFHPTFLYESIGNLAVFSFLVIAHIFIIKKYKTKIKPVISYKLLVASYLILYSTLRLFLEFIRIDRTPELLGLRFPQIISLIIIFLTPLMFLLPKYKKFANLK